MFLDNREIAGLITIFVIILLIIKTNRKQVIIDLVKQLLGTVKLFLKLFFPYFLYVSLIIAILRYFDAWNFEYSFKTTIYWIAVFLIPSVLSLSNKKWGSVQDVFLLLKKVASVSVLYTVIVNFYTFNLFVEVLLVLLFTFLSLIILVPGVDKLITNGVNLILKTIGLVVVLYAIVRLVFFTGKLEYIAILYDFILPVVLSIYCLPLFYFISWYIQYENSKIKRKLFDSK